MRIRLPPTDPGYGNGLALREAAAEHKPADKAKQNADDNEKQVVSRHKCTLPWSVPAALVSDLACSGTKIPKSYGSHFSPISA